MQEREGHCEATVGEICEATGIDLKMHQDLMREIESKDSIEVLSAVGMAPRLRYKPPHGVRNKAGLLHLLSRAMPGMEGAVESLPWSKKVAEGYYPEVEADLEALVQEGRCTKIDTAGSSKQQQRG